MNSEEMMNPSFSPKGEIKEPLSIRAKEFFSVKRLNKKPLIIGVVSAIFIISSLFIAIATRGVSEDEIEESNDSKIAIVDINPATQIFGWDDNLTYSNRVNEQNISAQVLPPIDNNLSLTPPTLLPIPKVDEVSEYPMAQIAQMPQAQFDTMPTPRVQELKTYQNPQNQNFDTKDKLFSEALNAPTTINKTAQHNDTKSHNSSSQVQAKESNLIEQSPHLQDSDYLAQTPKKPFSPYEIKKGTIIPSVLISSINSQLPSEVIAQVSENVYDSKNGKYLLIPQGSKLVGLYNASVSYAQSRIMIVWSRINFSNGKSLNIENMNGIDQAGKGGFNDITDNHYIKIFGSAFLISLISGEFSIANKNVTINSSNGGYGDRVSQTGEKMLEKNMAIAPTLEIRSGYRFNIFVNKDMILEPL